MENLNRKIGHIIVVSFWLIMLSLLSSCALTYEHPKCYLMLQGKSCLLDHSCCNPQTYNPLIIYQRTSTDAYCNHCRGFCQTNHYCGVCNDFYHFHHNHTHNWLFWHSNLKPNNKPSFNNNNSNNNGSTRPNQTNTTRKPRK